MDPWHSAIPDTVTVEQDGKQIPLREMPFVKESPDLPTFAKRAFDTHREIGARIPVKIAKPEDAANWKKEHLPKLYAAGILEAPPATPAEYGITKPADLPEGLVWSDELSGKLGTILHKHGVPKAAVAELIALHREALLGTQQSLKTDRDTAESALRKEFGDKYDERYEQATRLVPMIFKTEEELNFFEATGLANHPMFLGPMMRLAPLAQQDSSFLKDATKPGGGMSGDEVRATVQKMMNDKTDPWHNAFWGREGPARQQAAEAHIDELYKKAYGDGKVDLVAGINVAGRP